MINDKLNSVIGKSITVKRTYSKDKRYFKDTLDKKDPVYQYIIENYLDHVRFHTYGTFFTTDYVGNRQNIIFDYDLPFDENDPKLVIKSIELG